MAGAESSTSHTFNQAQSLTQCIVLIIQSEANLPHPPWYRLYTRITDVVWLHGVIIEHAAAITRAAEHVRAIEEEEERQRDVLELEVVIDDDVDPYDDGVVRDETVKHSVDFTAGTREIISYNNQPKVTDEG